MQINDKVEKNYLEKLYICLIFFFALIIRLPYFGVHLTGDEDTYIILGNWISKGNLPEVGLSDGKPATLKIITVVKKLLFLLFFIHF